MAEPGSFYFEPLDPGKHDRTAFDCGEQGLDNYLKTQANQDAARGVAACFVAATAEGRIAGFYTLSAHMVPLDDLPEMARKKLPRGRPVPAALLGRLAVDAKFRGTGLGSALVAHALSKAANSGIGAHAMVVDALNGRAASFYIHLGFQGMTSAPSRFFMPLARFRAH